MAVSCQALKRNCNASQRETEIETEERETEMLGNRAQNKTERELRRSVEAEAFCVLHSAHQAVEVMTEMAAPSQVPHDLRVEKLDC